MNLLLALSIPGIVVLAMVVLWLILRVVRSIPACVREASRLLRERPRQHGHGSRAAR
jgi:uncharacterized membrane protein